MSLAIEGCTVVSHSDHYGLVWNKASTLIIRNATVKVRKTQNASIQDRGDIKLEGCKIKQPADATFDENTKGKYLMKDGNQVTSEGVIVPDNTGLACFMTDVPIPTNGVYTLDEVYLGTNVDSLPQGVYIVDGKKVIKN